MKVVLLALLTLGIPEVISSRRPTPTNPFAKLEVSLYDWLKSDERIHGEKYCGIAASNSSETLPATATLRLDQVENELNRCEAKSTAAERVKTVGIAAANFVKDALKLAFRPVGLLPVSLLNMISAGECSSRKFMESLVESNIAEYHVDNQNRLVRGWKRSYEKISFNEHRFHQLLSLDLDMSNAYYRFLPTDQNLKEHSSLIARDYVNARMLLLAEIINATATPEENVEYRRKVLRLIEEVVVYIKQAVELVRIRQYTTSKAKYYDQCPNLKFWEAESTILFEVPESECGSPKACYPLPAAGPCLTGYTYKETKYEDLFKANACPIFELEHASIPVQQWREIVDELVSYPGVCAEFDCRSVQTQLH